MLYSREFYGVIKAHLKPNGILAQWFPSSDERVLSAGARSLTDSFQHVAVYRSLADWGFHLLASEAPIPEMSPAEFVARLPQTAQGDLIEWVQNDH